MEDETEGEASRTGRRSKLAWASDGLEHVAHQVTRWTGGNGGFATACVVVLVWLLSGPLFDYSDTWQLVINTGTTIVTFLMVFLIQRTQNKEARVVQLKLNEIVAAIEGASNRLIGAEELSEQELEILGRHYRTLIERVKQDVSLTASHSVDEAERRHARKLDRLGRPEPRSPAVPESG